MGGKNAADRAPTSGGTAEGQALRAAARRGRAAARRRHDPALAGAAERSRRAASATARPMGQGGAGSRLPRRARRRARGQGWRTLTFAEARAQGAARSRRRSSTAALAERPVLILSENGIDHGARGARRHAYRRAGGAGLDGLCAAQQGFREAAPHLSTDRAAARLYRRSRRATARRSRRSTGAGAEIVASGPASTAGDDAFADLAATRPTAASTRRTRGRAGHRRQDPLHLRLDRPAQGRDQHAAHALLEPGERSPASGRSSKTSRR